MSSNCTNLYYTYTLREYIDGAFIPDTSNRGFPRRISKYIPYWVSSSFLSISREKAGRFFPLVAHATCAAPPKPS